ncbi:MAG: hypothetical protein ACR2HN_04365, partial [Tepidiformaceae bacterium]
PPTETAARIDLLALRWGIEELLLLPRRLILSLGDEASTDALRLAASRIERGIRQPAGDHAVAAAIRSALWPS